MYSTHTFVPCLQKSKTKMISCDLSDRELFQQVGVFHNIEIYHPTIDGGKIQFAYLFLPNNNQKWYLAFKPVKNKSGEIVSVTYEFGGDWDAELAAMALMHLAKNQLSGFGQLAFKIPPYEKVLKRFQEGSTEELDNEEWENWFFE